MTYSLVSVNSLNGEINWICETTDYPLGTNHSLNSPATPTLVTDGKNIFAYFGSAGLFCVDIEGSIIWKNTNIKYENLFGVAVSPIIHDRVLIIVADQPISPYIVAIDCTTGNEVWKKDRINDGFGHNGISRTPIILNMQNKKAVIVWGRNELTAYDIYTGDVLKSLKLLHILHGDGVASIVSDNNSNLFLSSPNKVICLNLNKLNNENNPVKWSTSFQEGPNCATPVLVNDLLFMVSERGNLSCLDIESGKLLWRKKLKGLYFSSPVGLGNSVIFANHQGLITVISAKNTFEKVSEINLAERTMASIALSYNRIIIRTESHLYCFITSVQLK